MGDSCQPGPALWPEYLVAHLQDPHEADRRRLADLARVPPAQVSEAPAPGARVGTESPPHLDRPTATAPPSPCSLRPSQHRLRVPLARVHAADVDRGCVRPRAELPREHGDRARLDRGGRPRLLVRGRAGSLLHPPRPLRSTGAPVLFLRHAVPRVGGLPARRAKVLHAVHLRVDRAVHRLPHDAPPQEPRAAHGQPHAAHPRDRRATAERPPSDRRATAERPPPPPPPLTPPLSLPRPGSRSPCCTFTA